VTHCPRRDPPASGLIGTRNDPPAVLQPAPRPTEGTSALEVFPALILAAAATVIALLAAVRLWRPPAAPLDQLTISGRNSVFPEHDLSLYLTLGLLCLVGSALIGLFGGGGRRERETTPLTPAVRMTIAIVAAVASVLVAVHLFDRARYRLLAAGPRIYLWEMALSCLMVAALVMAARALAPARPAPAGPAPPAATALARFRWRPADVIVPLVVVALVYLPDWHLLAGNAFAGEEFLHIDFFVMGPAVALRHGLALGTDVHVYYGMGWALVLDKLPLMHTLSYGRFIGLEVIYGCIYFIAVYALLRLFTGSWQWAVTGTLLAILLQLFGSFSDAFVMWRFPSATVLRWMWDVWFFLACLLYLRTRRDAWLVVAGVFVGLAILFQTDTGLYLSIAAAFFWAGVWRLEPGAGRRLVRTGAAAGAAGGAVLFLGLGVASRWTLFSSAFWDGWLENLRITRAGGTLLPLYGISGPRVLFFFALMVMTYLALAGHAVVRLVHRRLTPDALLLGTIGLYGFLTLLYYVGRSNPHNLFRPAVPFAILIACVPTLLRSESRAREHRPAARAVPWLAMAMAGLMLVSHHGFYTYPSLLKTVLVGSEPEGICVFGKADVCDIEPADPDYAGPDPAAYSKQLEDLAAHLHAVAGDGGSVAILDSMGPLVFTMADVKPWGRYIPMFQGMFLRSMVANVVMDLQSAPPDIVVMRSPELRAPYYDDLWQAMRPTVERGYTLDSRFGPLEVWQKRVAGGTSGRGGINR
jgi:hypothetical protein